MTRDPTRDDLLSALVDAYERGYDDHRDGGPFQAQKVCVELAETLAFDLGVA